MTGLHTHPTLLVIAALAIACVVAGCITPEGNATPTMDETPPTQTATMNETGEQRVTVDLAAEDVAFDKSTITVPAGAEVTVNFDNRDAGIQHNFAVYETDAAQNSIFVGELVTGPTRTTYTFTAPSKPGTYFFRCDPHPTTMNGDFIVQ
jgi:plastocyanin